MSTAKQKEAARQNLENAREARSARAHGKALPNRQPGLSTAEKDRLDDSEFAFPRDRNEPLTDAGHVRNAIARFDQVEDVSDAERDEAWRRSRRGRRSSMCRWPKRVGESSSPTVAPQRGTDFGT